MSISRSTSRGSVSQNRAHQYRAQGATKVRARAQQAKLDVHIQARKIPPQLRTKKIHTGDQGRNHSSILIADAIEAYLQDHEGGNRSPKTVEWHSTSLGLLRRYLEEEQEITQVEGVNAGIISGWFAYLRKVPGQRGKLRSERTIQTYARSARAFFRRLMRREMLERNPFDQVAFPRVGRPLIQTIEPEEFERLLQACAPQGESGWLVERAIARNRAIFWLFY